MEHQPPPANAPYKPDGSRYTRPSSSQDEKAGRLEWAETALRPSITQRMEQRSIEECRLALAASYGCDERDMSYTFRLIKLINYETGVEYFETDFLWLVYTMKFVIRDEVTGRDEVCVRDVFKLKIIVPDHVKAEAARANYMALPPTMNVTPAPAATSPPGIGGPVDTQSSTARAKPVMPKRPNRK